MLAARLEASRTLPADLEAYWLPFTANRAFKAAPRIIARAKGMHYYTAEGRAILDGTAGLWCVNAGHVASRSLLRSSTRPPSSTTRPRSGSRHPTPSRSPRAGRARAGGPRPCLLLQLRLGSRRHRAQDRARLSPRARRGHAHAPDRPRARLSWRRLGGMSVGGMVTTAHSAPAARGRSSAATPTAASNAFTRASRTWGADCRRRSSASCRCTALRDIAAVIVEPSRLDRRPPRRPRAICSACARSATSTASC